MHRKHRNDKNHSKDGWVGGNPRYSGKGVSNQRKWRPKHTRAASKAIARRSIAERKDE